MKIEGWMPEAVTSPYRAAEKLQTRANGSKGPSAGRGDIIDISSEARVAKELALKLETIPDLREDLLVSLAQRIDKGEYEVDGETLADSILGAIKEERSCKGD